MPAPMTLPTGASTREEVAPPPRPAGPSGVAILPASGPRAWRFVIGWAAGWAVVGTTVAAGIVFALSAKDVRPLALTSVLFAEVVGFTALLSARLAFPLYVRLPLPVRLALQVLTLFAGTILGSAAILATQPLYLLANLRLMAMIVLINAVLAVLVGLALHTYDAMRRQLELAFEMQRQKEALEREVSIAREVQRELLPRRFPDVEGLELAGVCIPAVGVGGDYFDFLVLPDDRVGLVIADVSGKGIPAALLMAGLQASVRSLARPGAHPCDINRALNEMLYRNSSAARYATLFFALYDPRGRELVYSNAGHHPPLHLAADGIARLSSGGIPIGLFPEADYGEGRRRLDSGDLLVLFTDGVIEAPDPQDREFGGERLVRLLETHRDRPLPEICDAVVRDVTAWQGGGPSHDDITLLIARAR